MSRFQAAQTQIKELHKRLEQMELQVFALFILEITDLKCISPLLISYETNEYLQATCWGDFPAKNNTQDTSAYVDRHNACSRIKGTDACTQQHSLRTVRQVQPAYINIQLSVLKCNLRCSVLIFPQKITGLNTENYRLKKNISALLQTARREVARKDVEIQRLNQRQAC